MQDGWGSGRRRRAHGASRSLYLFTSALLQQQEASVPSLVVRALILEAAPVGGHDDYNVDVFPLDAFLVDKGTMKIFAGRRHGAAHVKDPPLYVGERERETETLNYLL